MKKKLEKRTFFSESVKALLSAVILVLFAGLTFIATEQAAIVIRKWWYNSELLVYLVAGVVLALFIVLILVLLMVVIEWPLLSILGKVSKKIYELLTKKEIGVLDVAKEITDKNYKLKHLDKIVITGQFNTLQSQFMEIVNGDLLNDCELRIVGTMLGTYGNNFQNISLADELVKISKKKNSEPPFKKAFFSAPRGGREEDRTLFSFATRVITGQILIKLHKNWGNSIRVKLRTPLEIHLTFSSLHDIFPAIQLWGNEAAMVLSSVGVIDRIDRKGGKTTSIGKAMPVAIILKKEYELYGVDKKCDLTDSLKRLKKHLEIDYMLVESDENEVWSLDRSGKFSITNFDKDNDLIEFSKLVKEDIYKIKKSESDRLEQYLETLKDKSKKLEKLEIQEFEKIINLLKDITLRMTDFNN